MYYKIIFVLFFSYILWACEQVSDNQPNQPNASSGEWLIPQNEVFDGGPGKDGIPAINNPSYISANSVTYLNDNDLVIAIKIDDEIRVYPHPILDWHEIINDGIGDNKFSITYCPLTGSGIAYNRILNGKETTFGVSGLLYNTNLIPYDRATNSNWSQMKLQSVNGDLIAAFVETLPIIETSWKTIKEYYPDSKVVSTNTGYSRSYGLYPYGDYKTNNNLLLFPVSNNDSRLPRKERVLGVLVNETAKAFRFNNENENLSLTQSSIEEIDIVILGSRKDNFMAAYQNTLEDGKSVNLKTIENSLPLVMEDQFNNKYDLLGTVIEGTDQGKKLKSVTQFIAYWFAWVAFYPETTID